MACAFRRRVKCGGHMLVRVLGGGCYLTCHPSTTGGLRSKHILPSDLLSVSIWWTRDRGSERKGSAEGVGRDNDDDCHFSLSPPIVCCCCCPETQHICSYVCVRVLDDEADHNLWTSWQINVLQGHSRTCCTCWVPLTRQTHYFHISKACLYMLHLVQTWSALPSKVSQQLEVQGIIQSVHKPKHKQTHDQCSAIF